MSTTNPNDDATKTKERLAAIREKYERHKMTPVEHRAKQSARYIESHNSLLEIMKENGAGEEKNAQMAAESNDLNSFMEKHYGKPDPRIFFVSATFIMVPKIKKSRYLPRDQGTGV